MHGLWQQLLCLQQAWREGWLMPSPAPSLPPRPPRIAPCHRCCALSDQPASSPPALNPKGEAGFRKSIFQKRKLKLGLGTVTRPRSLSWLATEQDRKLFIWASHLQFSVTTLTRNLYLLSSPLSTDILIPLHICILVLV